MNPSTPEEWQEYVDNLEDKELFDQAIAAGSVKFMTKLLEEGIPSDTITEIHGIFARRFVDLGMEPPSRAPGCVVDYRRLADGI